MNVFTIDDLAQQFVDAFNEINDSDKSDEMKRSLLAGTARSYSFLFDLALNGVPVVGEKEESDDEEIDDPALDPENEYCSCGNRTQNFPVICSQCSYMSSID